MHRARCSPSRWMVGFWLPILCSSLCRKPPAPGEPHMRLKSLLTSRFQGSASGHPRRTTRRRPGESVTKQCVEKLTPGPYPISQGAEQRKRNWRKITPFSCRGNGMGWAAAPGCVALCTSRPPKEARKPRPTATVPEKSKKY